MRSPASAAYAYLTPCISPEGLVFCPPGDGPEVLVFDANGTPLPTFSVNSLGLSNLTSWSAYAPGDALSLLLADCNGESSRLVAVDTSTRTVRWTSADLGCDIWGVAALSSLGIVVISTGHSLFAHRLSAVMASAWGASLTQG